VVEKIRQKHFQASGILPFHLVYKLFIILLEYSEQSLVYEKYVL